MSYNPPTEFEALKVVHKSWKSSSLGILEIKHVLLVDYSLKLLKVDNNSIIAESLDGKSKYSLE